MSEIIAMDIGGTEINVETNSEVRCRCGKNVLIVLHQIMGLFHI